MRLIVVIAIILVFLAYVGGYHAARSANSAVVVTTSISGNRTNVCTCFLAFGTKRPIQYPLFYLFYPLGRLDKYCNRREYTLTDFSVPGAPPHTIR